ncbi:phospholipid-translocating P-type ATPase [Martensiomyces pterosporus]|nr:phospholipid-translocating P-type ATPase [Martensiomyces pterosporus]
MRYPDEVITVPASLTKRVHYEVSYDYPKNAISTARYNVVTFLPAQLAAQFSKVANVYFLFIAALQQVPGWSTTGRWSTVLPLCIFISLSIAHEGFDDLRRHRMDHAENTQRTRVLKNMSCRWKKKRWENVQVGDLLMISKDEWIPADCVVIASSGFDGTCFVETAALDGETTLKQKQALEATNSEIQTPEQLAAFNAFTYVEPPSAELYSFEGYMEIGGERYPLTPNQVLLRGSVLRNTAYVFAQVVYSGEQTRLRLNATRNVRTKAPQIQRITNRVVILVFLILLILCFVFSALGIHWNNTKRRGHWYLGRVHMPATALIFGYIVMMNSLIPISLYVTLEAVKIFQCWFIQQDVSMYHAETDTKAEAHTTAINEDLGMVRYVFSDKTGTLTENIMKLRAVMVAGFSYLHIDLDRLHTPTAGNDEEEQKGEAGEEEEEEDAEVESWFLRCIALCHTVQPDRDPLTGRITGYQATSPDEKALVAAAAELGYSFDRGVPAPDHTDRLGNYEVLDVLEFSSARKRMSVIYRCPDGRIIMMSKGADSAIWPRLFEASSMVDAQGQLEALHQFSTEGLRTLAYAHKDIPPHIYEAWHQRYVAATTALANRQKQIEAVCEEIEGDLLLTGISAIEDRLQAGVPETIFKLRRAGIRVWMLTGDKVETAINIAKSCRLIDTEVVEMTKLDPADLEESKDKMVLLDGALSGGKISDGASLAVVIDGETLAALEQYQPQGLLDKFLSLGTLCDAVICSRVSPSQKALVHWNPLVDLLTHNNDNYAVTLAIGDGGNDIAMIQEAHVGIGIAGQEGLQASRAADFSIGQFRFLQKLLLVHGRWSYVRVSMFIMGTFYKCMAFYTTQLIFQFYTGFSGTSVFETWTLSMYNTLFSILPVLVVGIFEQDLLPDTLLAYPELYRDMGPRNHLFTVPLFIRRVVVIGILHSIIAAYFPFATNLFLGREASSNDLYITGFVVYGIMVLIVTFKIAYVDVRRWVVFSHISVVLTLALWFGWNGVLNHVYHRSPADGYYVLGVFRALAKKGTFWFQWIIFVAVALCLNVLILIVYTIRDPVEHRIMSWVAFERKREHRRHRRERRAWLAAKGLWESRGRRREHSHIN